MQCVLLGTWEFSYSNTFAVHVYKFIVGFKLAQVPTEHVFFGYKLDVQFCGMELELAL